MEKYVGTTFLVGEKSMKEEDGWWKSHLGEYLYIYCIEGEAILQLLSRDYALRKGGFVIVSPDMFPSQRAASADFKIGYCRFGADLADKASYDVPKEFFDCMYAHPVLPHMEGAEVWMPLFRQVAEAEDNPYRSKMAVDVLHAFTLQYYWQWRQHFGNAPTHYERSNADRFCIDFYNLLLEQYREHHDIAYYAERLCITPNYLAIILRRQCGESPKAAIDRQLLLGIKYQLRNTSATVSELASDFHFPDPSYLCRYFRRHTGMSLSEYRSKEVET